MQDSSLSKQLDKASAQLKRLSDRASVAEADAKALKAKNKAALQQKVDAAQASAKQASDDLKASAKETQDEITQWWGQVQENWKSHIARVRKNAEQDKANMKADQAEKSLADWTRALELNSSVFFSTVGGTECFFTQLRRWDKAAAAFGRVLEQNPQRHQLWYDRATLLAMAKNNVPSRPRQQLGW